MNQCNLSFVEVKYTPILDLGLFDPLIIGNSIMKLIYLLKIELKLQISIGLGESELGVSLIIN